MHEVIVVGAGPAGSAAAITLARAERHVLLLDKATFPRDKPCGDGISNTAVAELETLGVWHAVQAAAFYPTCGVRSVAPGGGTVEHTLAVETHRGVNAPRLQFDALLKEQATQCGATFQQAHVAEPIVESGQVRGVIARVDGHMQELRAHLVIVADGAHSVLASRLRGKPYASAYRTIALRGYIQTDVMQGHTTHIEFVRELLPGYAWIFPVGPHRANVGLGTTAAHYRRMRYSLKTALDIFLQRPHIQALLGEHAKVENLRGWVLHWGGYSNASRVFPGALLVGDAGAFINAATGAGIAAALKTGRIAAETASEVLLERQQVHQIALLRGFDRRWRNELAPALQRGYMLHRLVMSRAHVIDTLNAWVRTHPSLAHSMTDILDSLD